MGEQAGGALEVIVRLLADDSLKIRNRGREITQLDGAHAAAIERIRGVGTSRDGLVECRARIGGPAVVHVEVAEFLVISGRRVVANHRLQLTHAFAPRKHLEGLPEQACIRQSLDDQVDERTRQAHEQDDE